MQKYTISIPYFKEITKKEQWHSEDNKTFFIMRLNVFVKKSYIGELFNGEIIGAFSSPRGTRIIEEITLIVKESQTNINKTIETYITENELFASVANELSANLQIPKSALGGSIKTAFSEKLRELTETVTHCEVVRTKETEKIHKVTKEFLPDRYEKIYAVKTYKRAKYDIYFSYMDYLFVDYYKSPLGIWKKREKRPVAETHSHPNKHILKQPAFSMLLWESFNDSVWFVEDNEYENKVEDNTSVEIKPLPDKSSFIPIPEYSYENIPTLYQIANSVFPLSRVKQREGWTREQLTELETKENTKTWSVFFACF